VLSRLHPKKGLELFLDAFLDVTTEHEFEQWRLVMAGEGESRYVSKLKHMVDKRQGGERVLFTGWLDGDEKLSALKEAELLSLPSRQENFGLSVVEALACGVPVLISPHVNLADEIRSANAGWITSLERAQIVQTLIKALHDEGERGRRGAAGCNYAHRFAWSGIATGLATLYRSVSRTRH
jgi:glycosyltransferase involved in cell wall biosynthesis